MPEYKSALINLILALGSVGFLDFKLGYMPREDALRFLEELHEARQGQRMGPTIARLDNDQGELMEIAVDPGVVVVSKVIWLAERPVKEKTAEFSSRDAGAKEDPSPKAVPDRKAN